MDTMERVLKPFTEFTNNAFLLAASERSLPPQKYVEWGQQMLYLSRCFKTSMARGVTQALAVAPPALEVGHCLAVNLHDEFGRGESACCHIKLLEQFIQELDGEPYVPATPETARCVPVHEALSQSGLAENLAANWANEACCPIEFQALREGITGFARRDGYPPAPPGCEPDG